MGMATAHFEVARRFCTKPQTLPLITLIYTDQKSLTTDFEFVNPCSSVVRFAFKAIHR